MIIVSNPRADRPIQVPHQADGGQYRFEMLNDRAKERVYADTYTELVEAIIPGYADAQNSEAADEMRLLFAVRLQVELQAELVAAHAGELDEAERDVLLGPRHDPPQVGLWRSPVSLVLVETYYHPAGNLDRPIGRPPTGERDSNLIWLDPTDEQSLIESAHRAGIVTVFIGGDI